MYKLPVDILPHIYSSVSICTISTIESNMGEVAFQHGRLSA